MTTTLERTKEIAEKWIAPTLDALLKDMNGAVIALNSDNKKVPGLVEYLIFKIKLDTEKYNKLIKDAEEIGMQTKDQEENFNRISGRYVSGYLLVN
ncbi:MAG: hypothetical protein KKB62_01240 [Nanoarchaeota archaeon]|nr:hypothetical protein [Nanoarchaeota archaeon]